MFRNVARWLQALADRIADRVADRIIEYLVRHDSIFRCDPNHKQWWRPIVTSFPPLWTCDYCGRKWPAVRFDA